MSPLTWVLVPLSRTRTAWCSVNWRIWAVRQWTPRAVRWRPCVWSASSAASARCLWTSPSPCPESQRAPLGTLGRYGQKQQRVVTEKLLVQTPQEIIHQSILFLNIQSGCWTLRPALRLPTTPFTRSSFVFAAMTARRRATASPSPRATTTPRSSASTSSAVRSRRRWEKTQLLFTHGFVKEDCGMIFVWKLLIESYEYCQEMSRSYFTLKKKKYKKYINIWINIFNKKLYLKYIWYNKN